MMHTYFRDPTSNLTLTHWSYAQFPLTSNTSKLYSEWQNPSVPEYMQYYFWNTTNAGTYFKAPLRNRMARLGN